MANHPFPSPGPAPDGDVGNLLDGLNERQREAVTAPDGPLLVLAGAGSGKTRVITHRIAYLIRERGISPASIVAVTFTNKAAREMMDRISRLLHRRSLFPWSPGAPRLGTFHGFCLRLLRGEAEHLGYRPGFAVYDADDSKGVIKACLKELHLDEKVYPPARILGRLGDLKDRMLSPEQFLEQAGDHRTETIGTIYRLYQNRLRHANAMDFDDLIMKTLELFRDHPQRAQFHAQACRHLLVDEFQDTNTSQYRLSRELAAVHGNLFVVGDEDQSIYRFRGADINNILDFQNDQEGTHLIRLEQNYRSTRNILAAANSVVSNNSERLGKNLYTANPTGARIVVYRAATERDEANWVVERIRRLQGDPGVALEQQAILYRANYQSRPFEEALTRRRIPYTIIGSVRFYERREVKDLLSYLRVLHQPDDDVALSRILNTPSRGIGRSTLDKLEEIRCAENGSLARAIRTALKEQRLRPRAHAALAGFLDMLDDLRALEDISLRRLMEEIMNRTSYLPYLERVEAVSFENRVENLEELAAAADEAQAEGGDLQAFLDRTALTSTVESEDGEGGISLMTLHCAKGLEFPAVFVAGLEERLLPHARSLESAADLEEERRLLYVGMTRAMRQLTFSHAAMRSLYGRMQLAEPSRFLGEIPPDLLQEETSEQALYPSLLRGPEAARRRPGKPGTSAGPRAGTVVSRGAGGGGEVTVEYEDEVPADDPRLLRVGMKVLHPRYGPGTILSREGSGLRLKLTVSFPGVGRKKLMARYAGLRVL
ncbi:MAG: ATP-dependent helicase [Acidobacteriota bacterium]